MHTRSPFHAAAPSAVPRTVETSATVSPRRRQPPVPEIVEAPGSTADEVARMRQSERPIARAIREAQARVTRRLEAERRERERLEIARARFAAD